jgi:hypothetical protein
MPAPPADDPSGQHEDAARQGQDAGEPSTGDPRRDESRGWRPLPPSTQDWLTEEDWAASLASAPDEDDPGLMPGEEPDPGDPPPPPPARKRSPRPGQGSRAPAGFARAVPSARRGPGEPGSARRIPGDSPGPAGAFATGQTLDVAPGGGALHGLAEHVAGAGDRFGGASDDELTGVICALDRAEAAACALKHAAVAELIRRRPEPGCPLEGPAQMPAVYDEFTEAELTDALAETRHGAARILSLAHDLEVKLPGTKAAFRSGALRLAKVEILARGTVNLTPEEARAVEALVLGRAGRLTPGGLRSAVARAVIQVAPDKARTRREQAARNARVQRWLEDSGNAALTGRELPPADVLAMDQRINWWATELRKAGLDGDMDQLRALALIDIMLTRDSRPRAQPQPQPQPPASTSSGQDGPGRQTPEDPHDDGPRDDGPGDGASGDGGPGDGGPGDGGPGDGGSGWPDPDPTRMPPTPGVIPAGFRGCINLTITLPTMLGLAERPGELSGLGPVDPALARDLAAAAALNPRTTYCVTVTDEQGHAIGHGCARPEPKNHGRTSRAPEPRPPRGHSPPAGHDPPSGPRFTFTNSGDPGPPGGYGTWRLSTGIPGRPDLLIALDPIALDTCDHRFEARGHDPGVKLRHLAQIRHATCTGPTCRRPSRQCDFEHNIPYEAGGRTCLCNTGPKCRHEHRLKQDPRWKVEQITPGTFRWTAPSGRQYTTEPTRYPI